MVDKEDYKNITENYEYDGKHYKTNVKYFPDRNISTITRTFKEDETIATEIIKKGLTLEEIKECFPPTPQIKDYDYNRAELIRSIIYEAYIKEGLNLEEGNVRNFWYTHLKYVITRILGIESPWSISTSINGAWGDLINSGLITYEGMKIVGGKEATRISTVKDSPFSNIIIAIEKADYFETFKWIPKLFNCTLITAGGDPSRTVARAFIKQLKDLGVNLDQHFYMCVISDLDPAGYYIQDSFRKQYEAAINFYGGTGRIEIRRLFVRKDQVTEELLEAEAIPCIDRNAKKPAAIKAENTKWENFCEQTDGGLYIPIPHGWSGPTTLIDGEKKVRALLEMNAFSKKIIENALVKELLNIIHETNDESKIMIPEVMRTVTFPSKHIIEEMYGGWHRMLIQPLIDIYLKDTKDWENKIVDKYKEEIEKAEERRDNEINPIIEECNENVEEKKQEAKDRVPELFTLHEKLVKQIKELTQLKQKTTEDISEQCKDIYDDITEIKNDTTEEIQPFIDTFEEESDKIKDHKKYRYEKYEEFKEDHKAVFNPIEMTLKGDIEEKITNTISNIYFKDIEVLEQFKGYIAKLLTNPDLLVIDKLSCFTHPKPTFLEDDLLQKASTNSDENVGNVRRAFPEGFSEEIKKYIKSLVIGTEFDLKGTIPTADLREEVRKSIEETESEIGDEE